MSCVSLLRTRKLQCDISRETVQLSECDLIYVMFLLRPAKLIATRILWTRLSVNDAFLWLLKRFVINTCNKLKKQFCKVTFALNSWLELYLAADSQDPLFIPTLKNQ
jgi:hypothetical protein